MWFEWNTSTVFVVYYGLCVDLIYCRSSEIKLMSCHVSFSEKVSKVFFNKTHRSELILGLPSVGSTNRNACLNHFFKLTLIWELNFCFIWRALDLMSRRTRRQAGRISCFKHRTSKKKHTASYCNASLSMPGLPLCANIEQKTTVVTVSDCFQFSFFLKGTVACYLWIFSRIRLTVLFRSNIEYFCWKTWSFTVFKRVLMRKLRARKTMIYF